eukprot:12083788-Alexandrium_andersonii.AAC.1
MSASLVGSEMCIRDRFSRGELAARVSLRSGAACWAPDPAAAGEQAAVSYTHLTLPTICSV